MNDITRVIGESERFLREEGAEKYRIVDILEFMRIISENNYGNRIKMSGFDVEGIPFTQLYIELNGEYVYSTTIGQNAS